MRFFSEAIRGDLILIKSDNVTPQAARAIATRSAPIVDPLIIKFILWLLATFAAPAIATVRPLYSTWTLIADDLRPRWAVLCFLATVLIQIILESLATSYIERVITGA
jgi:hypothetical protein